MDWTNSQQWDRRGNDGPKMGDLVEMLNLTDGKWHTVRLIGKTITLATHWINTFNAEGNKPKSFPKPCHGAYIADDGSTQIDASKCPYCSILENQPQLTAFVNCIDRHAQENPPRRTGKPTRFERKKQKLNMGVAFYKEDKDTEVFTPVRVARITTSLGKKISEIAGLNTRKTPEGKKAFGPDHAKYGFDLLIKYNKDAPSPNDMYSAQKGENTKLSQEELELLRWNVPTEVSESHADAVKEAKRVKPRVTDKKNNLLFPELAEEEEGKKKKSKKDKHGKYRDQFDEDDDDIEDDDEDEDDDDAPKRSKKSKKSSKSARSSKWDDADDDDEDDDDDDIEDDEDDDEDERTRKKSKSSKKASKKSAKKSSRDDDEDEDEDEDDEDERPSRKAKSKSSRRSSRDDDDDDDADDDDDEDDDEDDRPRRKSKSSKGSSKSKKRSSRYDDDDDIPF